MHASPHNFSRARVLVTGDLILDRYWSGKTERISPEAPVPVVHVSSQEERPGGAGNVALNVASLGGQVHLLGVTGEDTHAQRLASLLQACRVDCHFVVQAGLETTTKLRILSQHQQLIRLDFEQSQPHIDHGRVQHSFTELLDDSDVVILSDYAKGALGQIEPLIAQARKARLPVLVDPKGSAFERYQGASLITPNLREFEAVVGVCNSDEELVTQGRRLCRRLHFDALLVTRSEQGMSLVPAEGEPVHLPARAREVFDVTGAGDTVIAVLGSALAAGHSLVQATALANTAAGLVVGKLGAASVTAAELDEALHESLTARAGVMDEEGLHAAMQSARLRGETLVMTNGCFDILHAGHVRYLRQARELGDRLIVAVNDDDSVRRLKGAGRPVNPLATRMEVLAALEMVDWVLPFSADTPAELIAGLLPDILVKGGDYHPDDIAGGAAVIANGGRVEVLDYHAAHSTTALIEAARQSAEETA